MKMEFWLLILVLCHATNSIESVNSPPNNVKIYKTFDEIFGEGWDDEEKPNLLGPNESQRMEASSTENCHENSHHNEQNGSEKSPVQTEHNELDGFDEVQEADKLFDSNEQNNQKNSEKYENKTIYSDDQKREIVQEYIKLKSQYCQKQKENVSKKEWNKFKANAAKKLGVRYNNVCRWQKQFGIDKKVKRCYDDRKCEIVQKYIELKNKFMQEKKHLHNEWDQFFASIPKELGVSHSTILKWQKQFFGVNINNKKKYTDEEKQEKLKKYYEIKLSNSKTKDTDIAADLEISIGSLTRWKFKHSPELNMPVPSSTKSYSDDRKREIAQEYIELKNKFMQEKKHSQNEWNQFYANISKELYVSHSTILKWQKQFFGVNINNIKKKYTDEEKQEKLKEYYEMKLSNPKTKDTDIAADLKISHKTLIKWKAKFKNVPELNVQVPGSIKSYSDDRKREIVQEFIELKNKFLHEKKHSQNEWNQFYAYIPKELGVSHSTILKWKKQFFGVKKKKYTEEQKREKMKKYYEIKLRNPTIKDTDIAADLKISIPTFIRWKEQFTHSPELNMPAPSSTKCYSDNQKREIVQEYIELKNKFIQEKQHSYNEWKQFEANISKELGVSHSTIFKWKKQFGLD